MSTAMRAGSSAVLTLGLVVLANLGTSTPAAAQATTVRASVSSGGAQANAPCYGPVMSADGRVIAFYSGASTLVPPDTNVAIDVFVRDLAAGTTQCASVDAGGAPGDGRSWFPSLSGDGRLVAFESRATNLVPGDTNGTDDIFVRDLTAGKTARVSVASGGAQANFACFSPAISSDGRFVAFHSGATNLVAGDSNASTDVFLHDRLTGATERVSVQSGGAQSSGNSLQPALSADGRFIVFHSDSSDLVPGDTNGDEDVFVHDRETATTERVSVATGGAQGTGFSVNAAVSGDGRIVAFQSSAPLVPGDAGFPIDVFVHDRQLGTTEKVSVSSGGTAGNAPSIAAALSLDGRFVAFQSDASNLVAGDTNLEDIFLRDRVIGRTERVNLTALGAQANNDCEDPSVSADGRFVAFAGLASNLVPGDTNSTWDSFRRDRGAATTYCTAKVNSQGCTPAIGWSGTPSASAGSGFFVNAAQVLNQKAGLLAYSTTGPAAAPFQGGTLCLKAPVRRTPGQLSGGSPSPAVDCSGSFSFDFNVRIASGIDPALTLGAGVWCQYYSRDPGFPAPNNTSLTRGLEFTILP
jgi:Tol biopolymer transport system component